MNPLNLNTPNNLIRDKTKWFIDQNHSQIDFKLRHLVVSSVYGTFNTFDTSIYTQQNNLRTAEIELCIDAASLCTGNIKRDEYLKSYAFFNVQSHPHIKFISSTLEQQERNNRHRLCGELTMKGVRNHVKLHVEYGGILSDLWGNTKTTLVISGKLNRNDWGLVWNSTVGKGGIMVSKEIAIYCKLQLTNKIQ